MPRANWEFIGNLSCLIPYKNEQQQIAAFLDNKTAHLDTLIEKKQQMIGLLNEKRIALITQAVTKGLDLSVPMKDSGVEWLGNVPEHWDIKPLKAAGKIVSGFAFDEFSTSGIRVIKISNIQTLRLDWTDESYIDEELFDKYKNFSINDGDVVFALTRPIISTGLKAAIANIGNKKVLLNQRNALFRPFDDFNKNFFYHVLFCRYVFSQIEIGIDVTGQQPNVSPITIGNIKILYPPFLEQQQIANHLDNETQKIDDMIKTIKQAITTRTALITAAVTGKIDVRTLTPHEG